MILSLKQFLSCTHLFCLLFEGRAKRSRFAADLTFDAEAAGVQ